MSIRKTATLTGALAGVAAMAFLGSGVAQAVTPQMPTGDYQLCGNVVNSSGSGVSGVKVTGVLSTGPTYTATTNSNGGYCLQGDIGMVGAVYMGAHVTLSAPGVNFGTWGSPGIYLSDFAAHQVPGTQSANQFDGTI